ncbi:alpha/beta fold hydrolase [Phenylobacterium sp.]|uniref:alpha/beta fold hydrolase n=1 Tax=Phenylobacterium sp. TaxID=1871053 RepID=UPI002735008C|nr:alpha/beta fold hydrolase [Phenylobacterium sp.]MDP3660365.1 alpha/beta fold hydrolase [Phenylobacterium sp.]
MYEEVSAGPPSLALTLAETFRPSLELATLFAAAPLLWAAPRGDGRKVLVLPGFSLDDTSTYCLRSYLTFLGYHVSGLGMGPNFGDRTLGSDSRRLGAKIDGHRGEGKIILIGHSLGGVVARQYARRHPDQIERVICLGSPFAGDETSMNEGVVWLRRHMTGEDRSIVTDRSPLPVPHTVIYSRSDGVVSPFDCRDSADDADNIEVPGSHIGLVVNAAAFRIIAERLAQIAA